MPGDSRALGRAYLRKRRLVRGYLLVEPVSEDPDVVVEPDVLLPLEVPAPELVLVSVELEVPPWLFVLVP
jgi:hypothetical protein